MATPQLSTRRQLALMQSLQHAADERAASETNIASQFAERSTAADQRRQRVHRTVERQAAEQIATLEGEFAVARQAAIEQFHTASQEAEKTALEQRERYSDARTALTSRAEQQAEGIRFQALAVYDARKNEPQQQLDAARKRLQQLHVQIEGLQRDALTLLQRRALSQEGVIDASPPGDEPSAIALAHDRHATALDQFEWLADELRGHVLLMRDDRRAAWFLGRGPQVGWLVGSLVAALLPMGIVTRFAIVPWLGGTAAVGMTIGIALLAWNVPRARRAMLEANRRFLELFRLAAPLEVRSLAEAKNASRAKAEELVSLRDAELTSADHRVQKVKADAEQRYQAEWTRVESERTAAIDRLVSQRDAALAAAEARYLPALATARSQRETDLAANAQEYEQEIDAATRQRDADFDAMASQWRTRFDQVAAALQEDRARCDALFPDWNAVNLDQWTRPKMPPEAIALGELSLPLQSVKNGVSADPRLQVGVDRLAIPALLTLDEQPRLTLTARGSGRRLAVETLLMAVLRFLTALPAGKLRMTLIDAAGLGNNLGALMHLNDYDEQITSGRIWTDSKLIDERLSLLSDHMERVLQKYLRNEFATIHDYNVHAGEIAEPYHLVVAANFPAGFTEASARKLATISASGPRCGVYTLLSVDADLRLPHEFDLQKLLVDAMHLEWQDDRFVWRYPLFEKLALQLDPLPERDRFNAVLRAAGLASREASRVEVPFEVVAPAPDDVWKSNSAAELVVPVGRVGANEKQALRLGRGTSQHVLISGKTGSGKSTLLHALITNLALHYAPDQVEFYLVDFKKGVEFKSYAAGRLPHARVIAIESEREFGVSVLERLDQELRRRGEMFRNLGVQDLAGWRKAAPDVVMPRTLLIVDEFQELFVADDRLAQDAALLLDRLVRQGRAFGVHVLLGSQTLAGAYSLARSTLGQMAVRIALECSEADAHLILSDENTAARMLSRPGEAIYNDQNGLVAGNHPFQVVWLPDEQRKHYLSALASRPCDRLPTNAAPIVFEGNVPASPLDNALLLAAIAGDEEADRGSNGLSTTEATLWLGSAVRIEPPTQLVLRRQGGHNLLVVGPDEALALGILTTAVAALAGQAPEARFTIGDGARPESPWSGLWRKTAEAVGEAVEVVEPRRIGEAIEALSVELARRTSENSEGAPAQFLVLYDLAQFRDLRQSADDFSFSFAGGGNGKQTPIDKKFRELLREGPAVGIHVLMWCESYNSLIRSVDRLALRDVEFRVALQMSASDSTSLIDSPTAGLLGEHRAIFYRDDLGTQTKFRPYGGPSDEWLEWLSSRFAARLKSSAP